MLSPTTSPVEPLTSTGIEERRGTERTARRLSAILMRSGTSEGVDCTTEDLSEGGFFVRLAMEHGVAVGQRYEITFPEEVSGLGCCGLTCYATVVRTARVLDDSTSVGAGMRFDQPLFL